MQKKFKCFFMCTAALVAGLTGCTKEIVGNDTGGAKEKGVPTYATFNFVISGSGTNTKALDMIGDGKETDDVKDIRLIIFKTGAATSCEVNEVYDYTSSEWDKTKSKTVQLTSGTKRIFVISNAESQPEIKKILESVKVGSTTISQFYALRRDLAKTAATNEITELKELVDHTHGYVMSNAMGKNSEYTLYGGIGLDESRKGGRQQNNIQIEVQRTVAKAAVYYENVSVLETADQVGKLTSLRYAIRNVNRSLYLFQKFASDAVDPAAATSVPRSPFYELPVGTAVKTYDSIFFKAHGFIDVENKMPTSKVYITENTSEVPRNATTTYAAIEGIFLPKKEMIIESFNYNKLTNAFNTIVTNSADASSKSDLYRLVNIGTSTGITANMFFTNKNLAYKAAYCIAHKTDVGFDPNNIESALTWNGSKGYIVEYKEGKSYYRLNLGEGNGPDFNPGVKRNYIYKAKITSFAGIGAPDVSDLDKDPDKPIGQKTHVTATISVARWTEVSTEHQL